MNKDASVSQRLFLPAAQPRSQGCIAAEWAFGWGWQLLDCWVLLSKNHVTKHIESKSGQDHVLCIAGGDFLHKMLALLSNVAAPGVRESTVLEYSSSGPWFLWNPGCKWKQCWFLSLHPVNTVFGHKLQHSSLPLSADKAKKYPNAICTAQSLRSNS